MAVMIVLRRQNSDLGLCQSFLVFCHFKMLKQETSFVGGRVRGANAMQCRLSHNYFTSTYGDRVKIQVRVRKL